MPSSFPSCPCTVSWLGRVAPLAGTTLCRFPTNGTPGHYTTSEPTSSLNTGSALSGDSPSTLKWQAGAPGPFPGYPRPIHCTRGQWRPGPRISGSPVPTTLSRPPMGPWPTAADWPGARGTHSAILTVRSHAPSPSTGLLHPSKRVSSLHSHQQQNDLHFVNLTNPLTRITLTPGSLGRESLLPPITHRTMHSTFTPYTQARWPHSLNMFPLHYSQLAHR